MITHKLIDHSKKYTSQSVMIPSIWLKMQSKRFEYVDMVIQGDKLIITPNFEKKAPKKPKSNRKFPPKRKKL